MRRLLALVSAVALAWSAVLPSWAGPEHFAQAPEAVAASRVEPVSSLPGLPALPAALPQAQVGPVAAEQPRAAWRNVVNVDAILDTVNPLALFNNKLIGVSHAALAPRSFFDGEGKGQVVGINGVSSVEMYLDAADYMSGKEFGVRHFRANSPDHLVQSLVSAYREGGPIAKLVIAAHGSPGSFAVGGRDMDGGWARGARSWLESLPADLFAPGAKVALISCSVAQGFLFAKDYGVESLREIFSPLLKQGGTVIASTRYVDPELRLIPAKYKSVGERLLRHLLFMPFLAPIKVMMWLVADGRSKFRKVLEIPIALRQAGRPSQAM